MTEAELRDLIRRTIEEILNPPRRRALVLFTGALLGFEDSLESLRLIAADGVELDYVQSPSAQRILDQDKIAALGMTEVNKKLVTEHQMLIIPTLTVNTAAKAAYGMADGLASNLIQEFVMAARPIVVVRTAACPDSAEKRGWFPNLPPGFAVVLRENLTRLASFGIRLCSASGMHAAVTQSWAEYFGHTPAVPAASGAPELASTGVIECDRSLISHSVVQTLPAGSVLRVQQKALVTAMAVDEARTRSIRIEKV